MRCSPVIISSYVRMLRTSLAENASHGMGERANAERASSEERASKRNPATTQPGLGVDLLRMNGSGVAAPTVRIVGRIVMPPLQRRREIELHAGSLEVPDGRVRGSEGSRGFAHRVSVPDVPNLACAFACLRFPTRHRHRRGTGEVGKAVCVQSPWTREPFVKTPTG